MSADQLARARAIADESDDGQTIRGLCDALTTVLRTCDWWEERFTGGSVADGMMRTAAEIIRSDIECALSNVLEDLPIDR